MHLVATLIAVLLIKGVVGLMNDNVDRTHKPNKYIMDRHLTNRFVNRMFK